MRRQVREGQGDCLVTELAQELPIASAWCDARNRRRPCSRHTGRKADIGSQCKVILVDDCLGGCGEEARQNEDCEDQKEGCCARTALHWLYPFTEVTEEAGKHPCAGTL